jgi:hypothetical protein
MSHIGSKTFNVHFVPRVEHCQCASARHRTTRSNRCHFRKLRPLDSRSAANQNMIARSAHAPASCWSLPPRLVMGTFGLHSMPAAVRQFLLSRLAPRPRFQESGEGPRRRPNRIRNRFGHASLPDSDHASPPIVMMKFRPFAPKVSVDRRIITVWKGPICLNERS